MIHNKWLLPLVVLLALFLTTPAVSAHVTLHPEKSSTDAWEKYAVRVPVEKDMNTTQLELQVPDDVDLVNVMPKDGWDYDLATNDDDVITSVTWEATDGGIGPNEFTEFYVIAANPSEPTDVSWNAYQTYEDGSVVEWDGDPDADEPAPVVAITADDAAPQHDDGAPDELDQTNGATDDADTAPGGNWLPIMLSAAAVLLALISLFRKRS